MGDRSGERFVLSVRPPIRALAIAAIGAVVGAGLMVLARLLDLGLVLLIIGGGVLILAIALAAFTTTGIATAAAAGNHAPTSASSTSGTIDDDDDDDVDDCAVDAALAFVERGGLQLPSDDSSTSSTTSARYSSAPRCQ